jgi:AraC-like DNA-binding protein
LTQLFKRFLLLRVLEKALQNPPPFISQQVTDARRFYLNLKPNPRRELTVVCGGWEHCSADYVIDRPTFPYFSVEYVASGRGDLELAGQKHRLQPGTVFAYGPGIAQRIRSSRAERLGKYFIDFDGSHAEKLLSECGLAPGIALTIGKSAEVRQAFETLISAASEHDRFTDRSARLHLEMLLICIARGARAQLGSSQRAASAFGRCRRYIEANFRTLRTVEEVAAACEIDVAYLTRLFRRFQDESPYRYLQRLQIQWAADRLQSSGCLIKSVAEDLSIDPFQFSRSFKRVYGLSPSAFVESR